MDYLKTDINGGMPFDLDDLRFEANAIRETFDNIGKGLSNSFEGVILWGCDLSLGTPFYTCSEGAVFLKGEVFRVNTHSFTPSTQGTAKNYWEIIETADPDGDEVFEDTVTNSTYKKRRVELRSPELVARTTQAEFGQTPKFENIFTTRAQLSSEVLLLNSSINGVDSALRNELNSEVSSIENRLLDMKKRLFNFGMRNFDCRSVTDLANTFTRPSLMLPAINGAMRGGRSDFFNNDRLRLEPAGWYRVTFKAQSRPDSNDWVRLTSALGFTIFSGDFEIDNPNNAYVSTHNRTVELTIENFDNDNIQFVAFEIKDELNVLIEVEQITEETLTGPSI